MKRYFLVFILEVLLSLFVLQWASCFLTKAILSNQRYLILLRGLRLFLIENFSFVWGEENLGVAKVKQEHYLLNNYSLSNLQPSLLFSSPSNYRLAVALTAILCSAYFNEKRSDYVEIQHLHQSS